MSTIQRYWWNDDIAMRVDPEGELCQWQHVEPIIKERDALKAQVVERGVVTDKMVEAALLASDTKYNQLGAGGMHFKEDAAIIMRAALEAAIKART